VRIKEEPVSEEGEDEDEQEAEEEEPMDTMPSSGLSNRLANGLPTGRAAGGDSFNGHPPPGCSSTSVARELGAFVKATFQRQFVLTLSELKRLFNLHLASLPPGHTLFSGISDRMLQDTVLAAGCKQILVPVSRACACWGSGQPGHPQSLRRASGWANGTMRSPHASGVAEPCPLWRNELLRGQMGGTGGIFGVRVPLCVAVCVLTCSGVVLAFI
jgi:hypothetical protein